MANNEVQINVSVNNQTGPGFAQVNHGINQVQANAAKASAALGSGAAGGMGLKAALIGVGVAAATTLAPAMGALVPMMAGATAAAGTLALGFSGIGDALKDQSTDAKKYKEDLKAMSPASRDMTRALVDLKKQFSGVGEEIQKVMLPGFTEAVKKSGPVVDILKDSMVDMAEVFGDAGKSVGKMMNDSGFQKDFAKNLKLGTGFVKDMTAAVGPLTRSLLHFGAVSKVSLDAFSSGIGDLASKGIPGFLKGLEPGIGGASAMLTGMLDSVNLMLPAIGRLSGALGKNFGPLLGAVARFAGTLTSSFLDGLLPALGELGPTADYAGGVLDGLGKIIGPLAKGFGVVLGGAVKLLAPVFKNLFDLVSIVLPVFLELATAIAGPLLSAFGEVAGADKGMASFGQGIKDFGNWIHDNRENIDRGIRTIAVVTLDVVTAVVGATPGIFNAFKTMVNGVMDVLAVMVNGLAVALGPIPGIGDKVKGAAKGFNQFRASVGSSLESTGRDIQQFSDSALPKLRDQRMKLDISPYNTALGTASKALFATKLSKKGTLDAAWLGGGVAAQATKAVKDVPSKKTTRLAAKESITAAARAAQRAINALMGKTVYITYQGKSSGLIGGKLAHGGIVGAFANGGATGATGALSLVGEQGPELVRLPFGSRVYPAGQSERMIEDGEPFQAFATGGTVTKAERAARKDAWSDLTVSRFGRMAGGRTSEFANALGSPGSLSELVSALNRWRGIIKAATSGATERGLLKALDKTAGTLIRQEKALSRVNAALEKARDKLSSLRDAASQLSGSVRSGIMSASSITNAAQAGATNVSGVVGGLVTSRDKAQSLAGALKTLKAMGLNAQSLSEIAQAGVEGGGLATAEALMGASGADIKQINALEAQIAGFAKSAGKTTADAMYAGAIRVADRLVKGLKTQQDSLEKSMSRLAKAMEKLVEKAFKGKAHGGIVGAASGGARGGLTWLGEQGPELARLPYGSTVYPAGQSRQMATAGGGGASDQPIVINLSIGGREFEQIWVDTGERAARTRGGDFRAVLSSRP